PPPTAAESWIVPSGNLTPPVVVSIKPATVSLDPGVDVPMPTLALLPRTIELLCPTKALAPIAVALLRLLVPVVFAHVKLLLAPVVTPPPDRDPLNVFRFPGLATFRS